MCLNRLILGDCIEVLKTIEPNSVDLIYLDPPFFSERNYEVIWGDEGEIRSFKDRWAGGIDHYIAWLKERVEKMYDILKPEGSILLHCDWHANAYIRVLILDKLFNKNLRNEIIWGYKRPSAPNQRQLPRLHDTIFWYSKSKDKWTFNGDAVRVPYADSSVARAGYAANVSKMTKGGTVELKEGGKYPEDWWDIPMLKGNAKEAIGYPTQKPYALLERLIKMASNEGDVVLDPFMGGGTTIAVADKLNRKWIGIDQSVQAVKVTELRLQAQTDLFTSVYTNSYTLQLHKYDYDTLFHQEPHDFETWIIGQYGGVAQNRKGGDKGVDGRTNEGVPIQVKQQENVPRAEIDKFLTAAKRYDATMFEKNKQNKQPVGYFIAFSFGKGAVQEVARLKNEENTIIQLITVDEIIPVSKKPNIMVEIDELSRKSDGTREISFIATAKSDVGIEFYSWDFNYDESKGFKAQVIRDKTGKQSREMPAGIYHVAIKAVDNNGLESVEIIKLKVNGVIERQ
ncbi:MAG: hypothetical protein LBR36_07735 [Bacteroidales bacterium]|jgi:DNA modification methylase|nr:hypothetical protein [Bacteroidales bacterium]